MTPVTVDDSAEKALVKTLDKMYVTVVGDLSLRTVEESGKNHGTVDQDLRLVLQAFVAPNTFVQSTK